MTARWTRRSMLAGTLLAATPARAAHARRAGDPRATVLFLLKLERVNEGFYARALREIERSHPLRALVE